MQTLERRKFLSFKSAERQSTARAYWVHVSRQAMACRFEVTLPSNERAGVIAAQEALDEIERLEEQLTIFRESSEVSFINRNAAYRPVQIEPNLFELLQLCRTLYRETDGAFDVTSGPLSRCWGFTRREGRIPEAEEIDAARSCVGTEKLALDRASREIRFERDGLEINLGSIGKGYALDRAAAKMRRHVKSALLSAGFSSMLAIGKGGPRHVGWLVGVRHPLQKTKRLAVLRLRDCAMSTSGSEEQFFEHEGRRYGHVIDPRTGRPAEGVAGVTVVAESAAVSDALATAFYVGGRELAERVCASHDGVIAIMLESGKERAVVFGSNDKCEVELIDS